MWDDRLRSGVRVPRTHVRPSSGRADCSTLVTSVERLDEALRSQTSTMKDLRGLREADQNKRRG